MTAPLTPEERVAAIEARLAAATPGPWAPSKVYGLNIIAEAGKIIITRVGPGRLACPEAIAESMNGANREFIANAREDVPFLLALVASLRAEVAGKAQLADWRQTRVDELCAEMEKRDATITGLRAEVAALTEQNAALTTQHPKWRVVAYDHDEVECRHDGSAETWSAAVNMAKMLNGAGYMVQIIDSVGFVTRKYPPVPSPLHEGAKPE